MRKNVHNNFKFISIKIQTCQTHRLLFFLLLWIIASQTETVLLEFQSFSSSFFRGIFNVIRKEIP